MEEIKYQLLDILKDLVQEHLREFVFHLNDGVKGFKRIPNSLTENADRCKIVDVMVEMYDQSGAVEVTQKILQKMNQNELAKKLGTVYGEANADTLSHFKSLKLQLKQKIKSIIIDRFETVYEGTAAQGEHSRLNDIYTELCVVRDWPTRVNTEHEMVRIEAGSSRHAGADTAIKFSEVFSGKVKTILTLGIAGIGKTISAQKFALDWAEKKSNEDIDLVFFIPFRELNVLEDKKYSLPGLLHYFYKEPQLLQCTRLFEGECKCLFIFDGLDEFRRPLEFRQKKMLSVKEEACVNVLVSNLITGDLLPSALVWITSRPAAANQIPRKYINRVTEIQGFSDPQKEEYFWKRISDEDQAKRIISHIRTARSLHIMCHIPVFCWISATVLQEIMKHRNTEIPKTLTEMYLHFLLTQINMKNEKYEEKDERDPEKLLESNRTVLLKLAELAFKQLMEENMMFCEKALRESSIDVTEAAVYSGIFTEIRQERVLHQRKVYCFVHLSFQEFLAAVYVFHCYESKNMKDLQKLNPQYREKSENGENEMLEEAVDKAWSEDVPLDELLKGAVDTAVRSKNGHLDLFLRFLLGISLESNQSLLQGLLTPTQSSLERTREHIKSLIKEDNYQISTERSINLFLCLSEMKDQSLSRELQKFLQSEKHSGVYLSPGQCSALAYMLLSSEEVLDELTMKKYTRSEECSRRLIPAVTVCRKALLAGCNLTGDSCDTLCSALQSPNSSLKELELSYNDLKDSGVQLLSAGLKSSHCKLDTLRLAGCNLTSNSCDTLCSVLQSPNSSLKDLDLSNNVLQDSGVQLLSAGLKCLPCKLEKLRLAGCNITSDSCGTLCSVLQLPNFSLKGLDLSNNALQDSGVQLLSAGLKSSHCKLETFGLAGCNLTSTSCDTICSVVQSPNSTLKELYMSNNDLQDSGVQLLSAGLKSSHCKLETLSMSGCMVTEKGCSSLASALKSNPSHLRELDLSYNHPGESGVKLLSDLKEDPHCSLEILSVDHGREIWMKPGLKKYAVDLTMDPKTAHSGIRLSEENRKVMKEMDEMEVKMMMKDIEDHWYRHFNDYSQVLSVESLTGRCYWEVEWRRENEGWLRREREYRRIREREDRGRGEREDEWRMRMKEEVGAGISLTYRGNRQGGYNNLIGFRNDSWSLEWSDYRYTVWHDHDKTFLRTRPSSPARVGVYLDWGSGTLSFYTISPETHTLTHLHTFTTTFTEPLYVGFSVNCNASVSLCKLE